MPVLGLILSHKVSIIIDGFNSSAATDLIDDTYYCYNVMYWGYNYNTMDISIAGSHGSE